MKSRFRRFTCNSSSALDTEREKQFTPKGSGKRHITRSDERQGRYVKAGIPKGETHDIAIDATLRAAAPYQKADNPTDALWSSVMRISGGKKGKKGQAIYFYFLLTQVDLWVPVNG